MTGLSDTVRRYYAQIDANDIDGVMALFAPDAVYDRAERTYGGAKAIREFFGVHRKIRGMHALEHLWQVDDTAVVAVGRFEGVGAAGDARAVGFADLWDFGLDGRVRRRRTFLALGHGYVEA